MKMPFKKPLLICVVGPTAIGKTSLAIALAKSFSTEIISADSRQFYKEMSIGTAVPSKSELSEVPHHFIQNLSIFNDYTVGDFERDAMELLSVLFEKNDVVIMVGGSGLYVDAVVNGLDHFPEVPSEIRHQLNDELIKNGIEALQNELEKIDPGYFKKVDIQNPHRIIRALEIYRTTGKSFSSFLKQRKTERDFETLFIGLTADREVVYDRINTRVDKMIDAGLIDEAKSLFKYKEKNALQTVGYRELFQYFQEILNLAQAISEIKKNTRRFSKRQGTWFKKNESINWFNYKTSPSTIVNFIIEKNAL